MSEIIESQASLHFADVTRVPVCQDRTDFASTTPRFLKLPQVAGEATEV